MKKCKCKKCGSPYLLGIKQVPVNVVNGVVMTYVNHYTIVDKKNPKHNKSGIAVSHC
jgi:hypothetical protein